MSRTWLCSISSIPQVYKSHNIFIFGKSESRLHFIRIKKVNPAAVNANALGRQQHVCSDNGCILNAGVRLSIFAFPSSD